MTPTPSLYSAPEMKWTRINGSWVQVPMILTRTPSGLKEKPVMKEAVR